MHYIKERMLIPGIIENWVPIIDLENMSMNDIPKKRIISFINGSKLVYKCRSTRTFILNTTYGLRILYKFISPFLDERAKSKIKLVKGGRDEELINFFHPSQLESKFGGEAEDVEYYWPPYQASKEYGEDQTMFTLDGEENSAIDEESASDNANNRSSLQQYNLDPIFEPGQKRGKAPTPTGIHTRDIKLEESNISQLQGHSHDKNLKAGRIARKRPTPKSVPKAKNG